MIRIFKRKTWRPDPGYPHGYAPAGDTRKTTVCHVETEDEARAICQDANADRPEYPAKAYFNFVWTEYERV